MICPNFLISIHWVHYSKSKLKNYTRIPKKSCELNKGLTISVISYQLSVISYQLSVKGAHRTFGDEWIDVEKSVKEVCFLFGKHFLQ